MDSEMVRAHVVIPRDLLDEIDSRVGHHAFVVTGNVKDFPVQEVQVLSTRTPHSGPL